MRPYDPSIVDDVLASTAMVIEAESRGGAIRDDALWSIVGGLARLRHDFHRRAQQAQHRNWGGCDSPGAIAAFLRSIQADEDHREE